MLSAIKFLGVVVFILVVLLAVKVIIPTMVGLTFFLFKLGVLVLIVYAIYYVVKKASGK